MHSAKGRNATIVLAIDLIQKKGLALVHGLLTHSCIKYDRISLPPSNLDYFLDAYVTYFLTYRETIGGAEPRRCAFISYNVSLLHDSFGCLLFSSTERFGELT